MIIPCKWCGTEHEAGAGGFCSDACHQNFNTACQLWGEEAYGTGEVSIWQLQRCLDRQAHCVQGKAVGVALGYEKYAILGTEPRTRSGAPPGAAVPAAENAQ